MTKNNVREDVHLSPSIYFGEGKSLFSYKPGTVEVGAYAVTRPRKSVLGTGKGFMCA